MKPITKHLEITKGSEFNIGFRPLAGGVQMDFTGYTANMPICDRGGAFLFALTTENGGIAIDLVNGRVNVTITAVNSAGLAVDFGQYELTMIPPSGAAHAWKLVKCSNIAFGKDLPNA